MSKAKIMQFILQHYLDWITKIGELYIRDSDNYAVLVNDPSQVATEAVMSGWAEHSPHLGRLLARLGLGVKVAYNEHR